jgi:hypothetical protein
MYDRGDAPAPAPEAPRPSDEAHIVTDVDEALTRRLTAGRAVYGPLVLATDTRDFVEEAWEEGIDLLVYLAAARRVRDGLREQLRQKTEEADNLRASTAELMAQRDDARRMYCEKMPTYIGGQADQSTPSTYRVILHHDPAQHALEQGWAGLYPAPVNSSKNSNSPKKTDGWGRCRADGAVGRHHADDDYPCRRFDGAPTRCGDYPHFEPEEAP